MPIAVLVATGDGSCYPDQAEAALTRLPHALTALLEGGHHPYLDEPDTFVLATNRTETVRDFVRMAFKGAGIAVDFKGSEEQETAIDTATGKTVMRINPKFYRPAEVELLIGDPAHAKAKLGWEPKTTLERLCQMQMQTHLQLLIQVVALIVFRFTQTAQFGVLDNLAIRGFK
jgi:nucleoside-diphosphate-sugar epimerase